MLPEHLLAVAVFMFSATITPGPNNIMVMTSSLSHGVLKTLPHYLGIYLGFPAMLIALGMGMSTVFAR
jgi:threonine/homoserine/homoserine lactone efflux protein